MFEGPGSQGDYGLFKSNIAALKYRGIRHGWDGKQELGLPVRLLSLRLRLQLHTG